jgi:hypothetical protein
MNKPKFDENERMLYRDGYRLAQTYIGNGLTTENLLQAISHLYATIDELNGSIVALAHKQNVNIACERGCQWCCHQAVFANSYEIHFLSNHISHNLKPDEINVLVGRAREKQKTTSGLGNKDLLNYKAPCPLLCDGSCTAYSARPVACRIYLSTSLPSCLHFFHHPDDESRFPMLLDFPLKAGRLLNEGFSAALREQGIETAEFRIEDGLSRAFHDR